MTKKLIVNRRVCRNNNCQKCDEDGCYVPESCEYGVLHALDKSPLEKRERRSGKTRELIKTANSFRASGKDVMIIFKHSFAIHSHFIDLRISTYAIDRIREHAFQGVSRSFNVFLDEISPTEYLRIEAGLCRFNVVRGFFS